MLWGIVLELLKTNEILVIRVLLYLLYQFPVGDARPHLDNERPDHHPTRLCCRTSDSGEHGCIRNFPRLPWQSVPIFDPLVVLIQSHSTRGIEVEKAELLLLIIGGFVHDSASKCKPKSQ